MGDQHENKSTHLMAITPQDPDNGKQRHCAGFLNLGWLSEPSKSLALTAFC